MFWYVPFCLELVFIHLKATSANVPVTSQQVVFSSDVAERLCSPALALRVAWSYLDVASLLR